MSSIVARYDQEAQQYEQYWAPVLDRHARALLDRVASPTRPSGMGRPCIVDLGTGTGVLALDAHRRWPDASVIGVDPARGMLAVAARRATSAGIVADDGTLRWLEGSASEIPLEDDSVDLVLSSFMLHLVPDRAVALHETLRVLRPGGQLAAVAWVEGGDVFLPSTEFDEAVMDLGIPEPEPDEEDDRSGEFRSPRAAADEFRRAGFVRVSARAEQLTHDWTAASYLAYKQGYDEAWLFELLAGTRHSARLETLARQRLAALPQDAFTWRAPTVSIVARRPA